MPAQSTLTTYENAPASRSANFSVQYGTQIKPIMCILNTSAGFTWMNTPSYVNEVLTMTDELSPKVRIGLRSNFSRKVRLNLGVSGEYNRFSNDAGDLTLCVFGQKEKTWSAEELIKERAGDSFGHGGGDMMLVRDFYDMLEGNIKVGTSLEASVESHLMALAAEESRKTGKVVRVHGKN